MSGGHFPEIDEGIIVMTIAIYSDKHDLVAVKSYIFEAFVSFDGDLTGVNGSADNYQIFRFDIDKRLGMFRKSEIIFNDFQRVDAGSGGDFADNSGSRAGW
jgi:hypothetical protein